MTEETKSNIENVLSKNKVTLFMKGTPSFPECGFSAKAVYLLKQLKVKFGYVNVLEDNNIRQGIKEYGNFPTLPQLYVEKDLIGGCDIMIDMWESGELEKALNSNENGGPEKT